MESRQKSAGLALSTLAALACLGAPAVAQEGPPAPETTKKYEAPEGESLFGEPLFVNGERVPDRMIKRFLVYGPGRGILEMYKRQAIIEDQIERMRQRYADEGKEWVEENFICTEEDYNREYDDKVSKFAIQFPFLDLETELRRSYGSVELFERATRQTLQFDKVFIPVNPYDWPLESVEAIRPEAEGAVLEDAYRSYEIKKRMAEEEGTEIRREGDVYKSYLRDTVELGVMNLIDIRYYSDGIDPDLALWMDFSGDGQADYTVTLDQIYEELLPYFDDVQIEGAKRLCARLTAARQALASSNALMDEAEFKEYYDELAAQAGNFFTMESVALYTDYFPSLEHFKAYFYLAESHRRSIEETMEAPEGERLAPVLAEYLPTANKIMGLGRCEGEVILLSAFDTPNYVWKDDGWEWAEQEAQRLLQLWEENKIAYEGQQQAALEAAREGKPFEPDTSIMEPYEFWTALREEYCEYWDAPPPMDHSGEHQNKSSGSDVSYRKKGKWGSKTRHDMQTFVGESHYSSWSEGYSIADKMFFNQEPQTVAGPFKGPMGWYLTYLVKRTPPTHPLRIHDDRHVELLKQGYGRHAFMEFCNEVFDAADIKGLEK